MLQAILNKSWRQHPTKQQLYGHQPSITKTIQVRQARYAGHCWRSRDELISDVLLWTPTYGRAKAGRPARTYIQQLCEDTGCSPEDLPEAITIGRSGEKGSGISVLVARHDDDDDDTHENHQLWYNILTNACRCKYTGDSVVQVRTLINFWTFFDTRKETQFLKVFRIILC